MVTSHKNSQLSTRQPWYRSAFSVVVDTIDAFSEDNASTFGAALAYYTVFSLAPLLLIMIVISGIVFGRAAVQGEIVGQIQNLIGPQGGKAVSTLVQNAYQSDHKGIASIFGVLALLLGAAGVFQQIQSSLNYIWRVQTISKSAFGSIMGAITSRLTSLTMVMGIGFLLMVSLFISAALHAFSDYLANFMPGAIHLLEILDIVISFVVITGLFAMIFKYLPNVLIKWRDVIVGAAVTSLLFTAGKWAIGLYIGNSNIGSSFGAASSLVIILLWTYYSSQILFLGAEFTKVYANRRGSWIAPSVNAVKIDIRKIEDKTVPVQPPTGR